MTVAALSSNAGLRAQSRPRGKLAGLNQHEKNKSAQSGFVCAQTDGCTWLASRMNLSTTCTFAVLLKVKVCRPYRKILEVSKRPRMALGASPMQPEPTCDGAARESRWLYHKQSSVPPPSDCKQYYIPVNRLATDSTESEVRTE